jgi:hypothetical protein
MSGMYFSFSLNVHQFICFFYFIHGHKKTQLMFQTMELNIWKGKIFLFNTNVFLKFADLEDFSYWGVNFFVW